MDLFQALCILGQLHVAIGTCSWTPVTPQVCNCADGYADHENGSTLVAFEGVLEVRWHKKGRNYKTWVLFVNLWMASYIKAIHIGQMDTFVSNTFNVVMFVDNSSDDDSLELVQIEQILDSISCKP
jgi:hypothetical protein